MAETYSFFFRNYADAAHTLISRTDAESKSYTIRLPQENVLILTVDSLAAMVAKLEPYGISKIVYMHATETDVVEKAGE